MKPFGQATLILVLLLFVSVMATSAAGLHPGDGEDAGSVPVGEASQQAETPGAPSPATLEEGFTPVYLPLILVSDPVRYRVSGVVTDTSLDPVPGVSVVDESGRSVQTDENGRYVIDGLARGEHALAPEKDGLIFSPSVLNVNVPAEETGVDFTALSACGDVVSNGGFEKDSTWIFPLTPYQAGYTSSISHGGNRSARTGIARTAENTYSYSSVQQLIKIPSDASSATLRLWLYPVSEEAVSKALPPRLANTKFGLTSLSNDVQYVLILDEDGNILETLLWFRSNEQRWSLYEFNLSKYAGERIKIHAGTFNDGTDGVTSMYVDDVSVEVCPSISPTATPTPTQTGTPSTCGNQLSNSSFELSSAWDIPLTVFPAGYSSALAVSGSRSMRTGIVSAAGNLYSYSDAGQWVSIPASSKSARLSLWIYPISAEPDSLALPKPPLGGMFGEASLASDVQYVLILDQHNNILDAPLWQRRDTERWELHEFDLKQYAGRTIKIQFGTFNNGTGGVTAMYVDDVTLDTCPPATPTPTPTPTATPTPANTPTPTATLPPGTTPTATPTPTTCTDKIVNGSFESNSAWTIPLTNFSAGYSDERALSGSRSMRTGITHTAYNRFSYSDARQAVSIPGNVEDVLLRFWLYPLSEESTATTSLPALPTDKIFGLEALSSDVQYVLLLDQYGNWIDTLVWQRSDAGKWVFYTIDLSRYAGETIQIQFGTYNDGADGVTAMFVDEVSLQVCP